MEGTVEICLNGTWGTIVDDGWGSQEAKVVCRHLGFASACASPAKIRDILHFLPVSMYIIVFVDAKPFYYHHYGTGTGPLQMDNVKCRGTESSLLSCPFDWDTSEDTHNEDAGVKCYPIGE